jgi:carbamoyltransferase
MYKLLTQLSIDNGYPIVINTSFNLKDQTMVRDGQEAIDTFMKCDMDYLVLGNVFLTKKIQ